MKRTAFRTGAALVLAGSVAGAAPAAKKSPAASPTPSAAPTPGPEVQKLGDFLGTWKMEGEMQKSPMGPAGKTTATRACAWFDGGFFLVCHADAAMPTGKVKGLEIFGWDADRKKYTLTAFDSAGVSDTATGTFSDGAWTYTNEQKMGKQTVKSRFVLTAESPDKYRMSWAVSPDGNTWSELFKGEQTRVKETHKPGKR